MEAILRLRDLGYQVELNGGRIRYRLPEGTRDPDPATLIEALADLKAHREEAVAFLQAEAVRLPLSPSDPLPAYPFAIRSRILDGAEVWIVPDSWTEPVEGPAYTHAEIRALDRQRPDPEALRAIHQVKVGLDGEVLR